MPFVHQHAPESLPAGPTVCLAIQADRVLACIVEDRVMLPEWAMVQAAIAAFGARMYIGILDGLPCWAVSVLDADVPVPAPWRWLETRALLTAFSPSQSHAVSCARQLLWWDRRHQHCGACGTPTIIATEERARRCPACGEVYYPSASPAIIVAVTRGDELLLAHNRNFRPGLFSVLAGFVDPGETLEEAVIREVREEVGIEVTAAEYVSSQPWSYPNSLMIGFRARHLSGEIEVDGKEIEEARWYRRDALPELPRHGTVARQIIDDWLHNDDAAAASAGTPPRV